MNEELVKLKLFLDLKEIQYNDPSFIGEDPISVPHRYSYKLDREIMGFFAAIFAWGQRKTIIKKCRELEELMFRAPYDFIAGHTEKDLEDFKHFKHRTFNSDDLAYFFKFFQLFYHHNDSLESAFTYNMGANDEDVENGLIGFRDMFLQFPHLKRTEKHIATPLNNSTCKRLNMFLRWMVRKDDRGVDFGIWENIKPSQLICPMDVHVARVARNLGIITRKQNDWKTVKELQAILRWFDPEDPARYDFSLFGLGVIEKYGDGGESLS